MKTKLISVFLLCFFVAVPVGCHKDRSQQATKTEKLEEVPLPTTEEGWIDFGKKMEDAREWEAAIAAYSEALKLNPKNAPVWCDLGWCHYAAAKRIHGTSGDQPPGDSSSDASRSFSYYYQSARECAQMAISLSPTDRFTLTKARAEELLKEL